MLLEVDVPNPDGALLPGVCSEVHLSGSSRNAPLLDLPPRSCVRDDELKSLSSSMRHNLQPAPALLAAASVRTRRQRRKGSRHTSAANRRSRPPNGAGSLPLVCSSAFICAR
jgi:hypothetical protein